jgi:four helix bundle protein
MTESGDNKFEFEGLIVYQKSLAFINLVYEITRHFPDSERYMLTQQFIRAAHSIALNIAEGTGGTKSEFKNFLRIAKRSVRECVVCITIAVEQKFVSKEENENIRARCVEISKMLNGLIKSIQE